MLFKRFSKIFMEKILVDVMLQRQYSILIGVVSNKGVCMGTASVRNLLL